MKKLLLLAVAMSSILPSFAEDKGNGGDTCENRIKVIRNDIESWILRGGAESLKLPSGLSYQEYESAMLSELKAGHPVICTDDKLYVGRAEKTCKNYEGNDGVSRIKCNLRRFSVLGEEDQYRLIHHEYAGLAGFEVNTGEESKYFVSNQLAAYLENQVVKKLVIKGVKDLNIELVPISGGTFEMGSPEEEFGRDSDEDLREVTIDYNFEMMTTEVTQDLYMKIMGINPSYYKSKENCPDTYKVVESKEGWLDTVCPNHPVESVTFYQVIKFISLLNAKTGMNYRLPTEAEWELAARAGKQTAYSFGNDPIFLNEYAIFFSNSGNQPQAVGPLRNYANKPNQNGLYDMHGNVREWTLDTYTESPSGGINPIVPVVGRGRVIRGGSWNLSAMHSRSASRSSREASSGVGNIGFRLVRTLR